MRGTLVRAENKRGSNFDIFQSTSTASIPPKSSTMIRKFTSVNELMNRRLCDDVDPDWLDQAQLDSRGWILLDSLDSESIDLISDSSSSSMIFRFFRFLEKQWGDQSCSSGSRRKKVGRNGCMRDQYR